MTISEYAASRGITPGAVSKRIKNSNGEIKVTKKGREIIISEEGIIVLDEFYCNYENRNRRVLNIMCNKQGPMRSDNSLNYRLSIPAEWVKKMGVSKEDPKVIVTFENNRIIVEKAEKE